MEWKFYIAESYLFILSIIYVRLGLFLFSRFSHFSLRLSEYRPLLIGFIIYCKTNEDIYLDVGVFVFFLFLLVLTSLALVPTGSENPSRLEKIARYVSVLRYPEVTNRIIVVGISRLRSLRSPWHSIRRKSSAKRKFYKGHHSFHREKGVLLKIYPWGQKLSLRLKHAREGRAGLAVNPIIAIVFILNTQAFGT